MRLSATMLVICAVASAMAADVVPGVSARLARERSVSISQVEYTLAITLGDTLSGSVNVLFDYAPQGEDEYVQLDFTGDSVLSVTLNDCPQEVIRRDGHILVPTQWMADGINFITVDFIPSAAALNCRSDYMYTLFVPANARSVFPCFDQPDLRGTLTLTVETPPTWQALSNAMQAEENVTATGTRLYTFDCSQPLPTYLMSWVAGDFQKYTDGDITVLHRQTDSLKVAQLPEICRMARESIRWMEEYTGLPYPFTKYDMVVLPGYQFGGMEHPGAIQFRAESLFLEPNPTPKERLGRQEIIAHETAHCWFGDLVTLSWFDDVWTKEVFANFMASKMTSAGREDAAQLQFVHAHYPYAYATDRTDGTHPIAQELGNLDQAGLLYGNIIYHKAPIMMNMLERRMGEDALRTGLQAYLRKHAWGSASWDDLIAILDSVAPDARLPIFSEAWVKRPGMPVITCTLDGNTLRVTQADMTGGTTVWPQTFTVRFSGTRGCADVPVNLFDSEVCISVDLSALGDSIRLTPNSEGDGYGYFRTVCSGATPSRTALTTAGRYAAVLNLTNAWYAGDLTADDYTAALTCALTADTEPLIQSAIIDALTALVAGGHTTESLLWQLLDKSREAPSRPALLLLLRAAARYCTSDESIRRLYAIWEDESAPLLSRRDYMAMAYRLAIMLPDSAGHILATERARIGENADLVAEFDFVSRACTNDNEALDALFNSLLKAENRRPEPWTARMLSLVMDPSREPRCTRYLIPALDALDEIQATGDIFFPSQWLVALTGSLRSPEARAILADWIGATRREGAAPLQRKALEATYTLRHP